MQITNVKGCACPGDILTYKCTVVGGFGGATILRGKSTTFSCYSAGSHGQKIILWHRLFDIGTSGVCNNGTIVGQSLRAENGSYTSQFNITVSSELIGETIECAHDNGSITSPVGHLKISRTSNYVITHIKYM